jgi:hypothetical protein
MRAGEFDKTTSTLEEVLGHKVTAVETSLKEVYGNK